MPLPLRDSIGGLCADTAEETGLSTASVYQAKSRVLKSLRERLQTLDPDNEV